MRGAAVVVGAVFVVGVVFRGGAVFGLGASVSVGVVVVGAAVGFGVSGCGAAAGFVAVRGFGASAGAFPSLGCRFCWCRRRWFLFGGSPSALVPLAWCCRRRWCPVGFGLHGSGATVGVGGSWSLPLLASFPSSGCRSFRWCRRQRWFPRRRFPVGVCVAGVLLPSALVRFSLLSPLLASVPSSWVPFFSWCLSALSSTLVPPLALVSWVGAAFGVGVVWCRCRCWRRSRRRRCRSCRWCRCLRCCRRRWCRRHWCL